MKPPLIVWSNHSLLRTALLACGGGRSYFPAAVYCGAPSLQLTFQTEQKEIHWREPHLAARVPKPDTIKLSI